MIVNDVSERDQLRHYTQELTKGFELHGHHVDELDIGRPAQVFDARKVIDAFAADWLFGIDAAGHQLEKPLGLRLASADRPFFTLVLEEPLLLGERLTFLRGPHVHVGFHSEGARQAGAALGVALTQSCVVSAGGYAAALVADEERSVDVFYAGHFLHPELIMAQCEQALMPALFKLFAAVSELWASDLASSPYAVLDSLLADLNVQLDPADLAEIQPAVIGNAIRYVRNVIRGRLMRGLAKLPLTVAGTGWDTILDPAATRLLPVLRFHHTQEMLKRSKVALNLMPLSTDGVGVRAWDTILHGASLVSTAHGELAQQLASEDYVTLGTSNAEIEATVERVARLLEDPEERLAMTEAARTKASGQTWQARAAQIARVMQQKDTQSSRPPRPALSRALHA